MPDSSPAIFEETILINGYECDLNGLYKPAVFFQQLTEAAHLHAKRLGAGFEALAARNLTWVLSRMKLKIFRYPYIDDRIILRTWPKTIQQKLFFVRDFEILDTHEEQVAAATSAWLLIDTKTRRLVPPRSAEIELPGMQNRHGLEEALDKIDPGEGLVERLEVRAGYSAVDIVGHVNNSRYVEWVCDTFPLEMYCEHQIDWIQVNYDHEVLPNEKVTVLSRSVDQAGTDWLIMGVNHSNTSQAFTARVHWKDK